MLTGDKYYYRSNEVELQFENIGFLGSFMILTKQRIESKMFLGSYKWPVLRD